MNKIEQLNPAQKLYQVFLKEGKEGLARELQKLEQQQSQIVKKDK